MGRLEEIEKQILDAMRRDPPMKTKIGGIPIDPFLDQESACRRQVYATEDVAANMIHMLEKAGITATVERCVHCGLVHLKEVRNGQGTTQKPARKGD